MILNHITSRSSDPDPSGSAHVLSRRSLLKVGAAAGGGLMLSLTLPFATAKPRRLASMLLRRTRSSASTATGRSF